MYLTNIHTASVKRLMNLLRGFPLYEPEWFLKENDPGNHLQWEFIPEHVENSISPTTEIPKGQGWGKHALWLLLWFFNFVKFHVKAKGNSCWHWWQMDQDRRSLRNSKERQKAVPRSKWCEMMDAALKKINKIKLVSTWSKLKEIFSKESQREGHMTHQKSTQVYNSFEWWLLPAVDPWLLELKVCQAWCQLEWSL